MNDMNRTRGIAASLATALALATMPVVGAVTADAHRGGHHHNHHHGKTVVQTKISIKFQGGGSDPYAQEPNFSGRVEVRSGGRKGPHVSDEIRRKCVADSRVKIYRKNGPKLASTRTDGKGKYSVRAGRDFVPGKKYLATVETKTFKTGRKKHAKVVVCKGSASDVIVADVPG